MSSLNSTRSAPCIRPGLGLCSSCFARRLSTLRCRSRDSGATTDSSPCVRSEHSTRQLSSRVLTSPLGIRGRGDHRLDFAACRAGHCAELAGPQCTGPCCAPCADKGRRSRSFRAYRTADPLPCQESQHQRCPEWYLWRRQWRSWECHHEGQRCMSWSGKPCLLIQY